MKCDMVSGTWQSWVTAFSNCQLDESNNLISTDQQRQLCTESGDMVQASGSGSSLQASDYLL